MLIYALISAKISTATPPTTLKGNFFIATKKVASTFAKATENKALARRSLVEGGSILSLSKNAIVFKAKKRPHFKGKLVQILQEYRLPKWFNIEEITPDIYDRAPGFEEIKALIIDKVFSQISSLKAEGRPPILFGLSFYDFDYLTPGFVNNLGNKIKQELKIQGIETKLIEVGKKTYLSKNKAKELLKDGLEFVAIKKSFPPFAIYLGKTIRVC